MIKWGTYVAREVEKLQESLANGGKMSTSEWADKKSELKAFLAKATDG